MIVIKSLKKPFEMRYPPPPSSGALDVSTESFDFELRELESMFCDEYDILVGHELRVQLFIGEQYKMGSARSILLRPASEPLIFSNWHRIGLSQFIHETDQFMKFIFGPDAKRRSEPIWGRDLIHGAVRFEDMMSAVHWESDIARFERGQPNHLCAAAYRFLRSICAHPYVDGNGRLARSLIYGPLVRDLDLRGPILALNAVFDLRRLEVCREVQRCVITGDWNRFVIFFVGILKHAVDVSKRAMLRARR